ncbi:ABC-type transport auxiliary lipoprotein family protein [Desulfuromonas sp. KJ2020]|uniref:ABC-type transport auxiliary lipoprotein family protein n=1 Tax=Desulfuromonas sp. KJ2020 TaxID=2919173 RepID=UPI0020A81844|nr:ABC-type transport auxiliary lipoprotein family protein [Desulfuromonas sp. KJ2020]MCP3175758.1 ABC-type transport auxiliary lipoprotein family protein [Desulfuromonas sp. KJ2020]
MRSRLFSLFAIALCGLSACVQVDNKMLEKSPPTRHFYSLEVTRPLPATAGQTGNVMRLAPFRLAAPFYGKGFIYRFDEHRYQSDYYHQFLAEPAALITTATANWLSASGRFALVHSTSSRLGADLLLEGTVDALYGDFRQKEFPKAVLELHLRLLDVKADQPALLFERRYTAAVPFVSDSPENLVKAWNQALSNILTQFEQDAALHLEP